METKFTPKPWHVGEHHGSVIADVNDNITVPGAFEEKHKEYYGGYLIAESVAPGNAALIQISPDMFDLLFEIKKHSRIWKPMIDPILKRAEI